MVALAALVAVLVVVLAALVVALAALVAVLAVLVVVLAVLVVVLAALVVARHELDVLVVFGNNVVVAAVVSLTIAHGVFVLIPCQLVRG